MMDLNSAKNIKCSNCDYSIGGKCPLGKSNKDLCFPYFVMTLNNNNFSAQELKDIETVCKWREDFKKDPSNKTILSSVYSKLVLITKKNSLLESDNEVIVYAIAETFLKELFLQIAGHYILPNSVKIQKIVPWFYSDKKNVNYMSLNTIGKVVTKDSFDLKR